MDLTPILDAVLSEAGLIAALGWGIAFLLWRQHIAQYKTMISLTQASTEAVVQLRTLVEGMAADLRSKLKD